jgi:CRISPR-associated protein Cas2
MKCRRLTAWPILEQQMEILVTYDVNTETAEGRKRLRRVAKACQAFGQRVQKSVFECTLNQAQLERLKRRLEKEMDKNQDSLRIYHLPEPRSKCVEVMGVPLVHDMHEPLVL